MKEIKYNNNEFVRNLFNFFRIIQKIIYLSIHMI